MDGKREREPRSIPVRRPIGALSTGIPRHWVSGDPFATHFLNALSSTFPFGEAFFVRSVRHYQDRIEDPVLRNRIRGFAGQEAQHSRVHDEHMQLLVEQGYGALETRNRFFDRLLHWHNRKTPRFSLAVTAALEHLTAILVRQMLLQPDRFLAEMDPAMARVWRWHALEEVEHKSVAFDVLMEVAPGRGLRAFAMAVDTLDLVSEVSQRMVYMLWRDGLLFDSRVWRKGLRFLFGRGGFLRGTAADYAAWFRADFHPDDIDDHAMIEENAPAVSLDFAG